MPVYYKHKLVHIHIPKNAGTAIESYFHSIGDMKWGPVSWFGEAAIRGRWFEFQHLTMQELRDLSKNAFEQFRSFAVVRNPYFRIISDYLWRRRIKQQNTETTIQCFDTFNDFLKEIPVNINTKWEEHIHGADKKRANTLIHVRPQHHYISDSKGKCLVGDVLKYERLSLDMTRLLKPYGISTDWVKSPVERSLKEYYNRAQLELINEIYEKDFLYYSYEML
jgi:Sulfotransferase family